MAGGPLAQLVEQRTLNPSVAGSIPARLTIKKLVRKPLRVNALSGFLFFSKTNELYRYFKIVNGCLVSCKLLYLKQQLYLKWWFVVVVFFYFLMVNVERITSMIRYYL